MTALSSWSARARHDAIAGNTDQIERLAIALGAIRSVVRVIDSHQPPMEVDYATDWKSYTDIPGGRIRINPAPLIDGTTPDAEALDVAIAFGMHEAGHSEESRDIFDLLVTDVPAGVERGVTVYRKDFAFKPVKVAAYLWNVVEDPRMEAAVSRNWPGFASYFSDALLPWLWKDITRRDVVPTGYGDKLEERLAFVFVACRFPEEARKRWAARGKIRRRRPDAHELAWWQAWQARYHDGTDTPHVTIQSALDHIAEGSTEAQEQLASLAAYEESLVKLRSDIRKILNDLIAAGFYGVPDPCPGGAGGHDQVISEDDAAEVEQLVREGLTEVESPVAARGRAASTITARKPEETADSQRQYVGQPDATAQALRAALVFRQSAPEWTEKLLKRGEMDDEELYRWAADDYRVFSQQVIESRADVLMGLLVDLSGSMHGKKLVIAQRLAQLFVHALHDQPGVETHVWGHTADTDSSRGETSMFTLWEPGDPMSRFGLIQTLPHSNNADGHAIAWCADQMRNATQPQKVLFVLSDGKPSAYEYGHGEGEQHVADVCRWARDHGVEVIQIAIAPGDLRPDVQARMFGAENFIGYESDAALPRQLTTLMSRYMQ